MDSNMMHQTIARINRFAVGTAAAVLIFCLLVDLAAAVTGQKTFASEQEAVDAAIKALRDDNNQEVLAIFGADANELMLSGDPVADRTRRQMFLQAYDEQHRLDAEGDKKILIVGVNEWPFPIPLVRQGQQWVFDTNAGREEILNRRIGQNELNTIKVILAFVDAQREYAMHDHDGDGLIEYAEKFHSDPNTQNGLYWETNEGEPHSPLGALVARAKKEGYSRDKDSEESQPYYGYYYRILTAQGPNAEGGAFDYIVNDNMIGGFAAIAYPAEYGNSGVMTFMVNHNGIVFQKDLGEETEKEALNIQLFDPDTTWTKAE